MDTPLVKNQYSNYYFFNLKLFLMGIYNMNIFSNYKKAGGLMYAFGHDYVFMRNDFGNLCLTEIELGM